MEKRNKMYSNNAQANASWQEGGRAPGLASNPYVYGQANMQGFSQPHHPGQGFGSCQQGFAPNAPFSQGFAQGFAQQNNAQAASGMFNTNIQTGNILKGVLIGAGLTYLLTNEDLQKKIFKGLAGASEMLTGAVEEIKERYEDAKAEIEAEKS